MPLMRLDAACPACRKEGLVYNSIQHEIAFFGQTLETLVLCEGCGYRHADVLLLEQKEPIRCIFQVDSEADLSARVVRGTGGTIRIPELGVLIEPGPMSESFVSNVEGVLVRVDGVLGQLSRDAETEEGRKQADDRRELLQQAIAGTFPFTIIIEDPYGNSGIIHDEVQRERPTEKEIRAMKTGMTVFDIADLPETAEPEDLPLSDIEALSEGAQAGQSSAEGGDPDRKTDSPE